MRISIDSLYIHVVKLMELRSTCLRRKVGAVLVKDGIILSTGYNGPPRGLHHCTTCIRKRDKIPARQRYEYCRAVHAEQNAVIQCALKQTNPEGSTLYCTYLPCVTCAKILIQAGIERIVYLHHEHDELSVSMMKESGIFPELWDLKKGEIHSTICPYEIKDGKAVYPQKSNWLKEIWDAQIKLQKKLGNITSNMDIDKRLTQVNNSWRNLCVEFGEMMQKLPFKEWKKYKNKDKIVNNKKMEDVFEEFIDMAHFLFNIGIALGLDSKSFYEIYMKKNRKNFMRQDEE